MFQISPITLVTRTEAEHKKIRTFCLCVWVLRQQHIAYRVRVNRWETFISPPLDAFRRYEGIEDIYLYSIRYCNLAASPLPLSAVEACMYSILLNSKAHHYSLQCFILFVLYQTWIKPMQLLLENFIIYHNKILFHHLHYPYQTINYIYIIYIHKKKYFTSVISVQVGEWIWTVFHAIIKLSL